MVEITLESISPAIQAGRAGDYTPLRHYFKEDYRRASLYLAKTAVEFPDVLNLKRDAQPRGFLEKCVENIAASHPEPQVVKEYAAHMLSCVVPRNPLGVLEHALYISTWAIVDLFPGNDSDAIKAAEWVTSVLFKKQREEHYRNLFHLPPSNTVSRAGKAYIR